MGLEKEAARQAAAALRAKADEIERAIADTNVIELPWPNRPGVFLALDAKQREEPIADVNKLIAEAAVMLADLKPIPTTVEDPIGPAPIEPTPIEPTPIEDVTL